MKLRILDFAVAAVAVFGLAGLLSAEPRNEEVDEASFLRRSSNWEKSKNRQYIAKDHILRHIYYE